MERVERDPLPDAVAATCAGKRWRRAARILVAVSGGADSVALLALLREVNERDGRGWRLAVAHLDHGLRGTAGKRDAEFVRRLCRKWKVPCRLGRVHLKRDLRGTGASLEAAAREARYDFLRRAAVHYGARVVATAHTRDDQAETVLFRILKGAGLRGLRGILPIRRLAPRSRIVIVRPLLSLSRAALREWLREHRIAWREDASNADLSRPRNRLRVSILPRLEREVNPGVKVALARLAGTARETHRWMAQVAGRWSKRHVVMEPVDRSTRRRASRTASFDSAPARQMAGASLRTGGWVGRPQDRSSRAIAPRYARLRPSGSVRLLGAAGLILRVMDWQRLPRALRPLVARGLLRKCGAPPQPLTAARLEAISRLAAPRGPWPAVTCPGGIRVRRSGDHLLFERVLQKKAGIRR